MLPKKLILLELAEEYPFIVENNNEYRNHIKEYERIEIERTEVLPLILTKFDVEQEIRSSATAYFYYKNKVISHDLINDIISEVSKRETDRDLINYLNLQLDKEEG